ncbi:uncharacterized protein LOC124803224 [Schistocerca piceifrons]|uniref:uncharacterized protein LOC124803224 n=1 Tax=Schistocerca piceifrons TaxID=274613 RepID=UPI001F5F04C6|nr:uncharacterized protein LOC124803224 [Schistocerca piceifrons]
MLLFVLAVHPVADGLRLLEVRVPVHAVRGQTARLECRFDLEGESLYSVKWYKDGREFYRFVPRDTPPAQLFPLPGVAVEIGNSTSSRVVLRDLTAATSGRYRCEVSGEAPSFQTVSDHGDLLVVALPEEGPRITGGRPRYQIGDTVDVNCTSGRSRPAAQLAWFINGDRVEDERLLRGPQVVDGGAGDGSVETVLGLRFRVAPRHFPGGAGGDLRLKCLATVATVFWRSREEAATAGPGRRAPLHDALDVAPGAEGLARSAAATGFLLLDSIPAWAQQPLLCMAPADHEPSLLILEPMEDDALPQ